MNALATADKVLSPYLELPHELLKDEVTTLDSKIQQLEKYLHTLNYEIASKRFSELQY